MKKHQVETEFKQKYGNTEELICPNRLHRWIIKIWKEGHVLQAWKDSNIVTIYKKGDRTVCSNYRGISPFWSRKDLCSDPTELTLKPHYPRGGVGDAVRLSFKPKHSRHDLLPTTTPGKVHRAGSTSLSQSTPLGGLDYGSY